MAKAKQAFIAKEFEFDADVNVFQQTDSGKDYIELENKNYSEGDVLFYVNFAGNKKKREIKGVGKSFQKNGSEVVRLYV